MPNIMLVSIQRAGNDIFDPHNKRQGCQFGPTASLTPLGTCGSFFKNSRYHWVVCSKLLCKLPQKKWVQRISVEKVLFSL